MATKSRRSSKRSQARKSGKKSTSGRAAQIKRDLADLKRYQAELRAELKAETARSKKEARKTRQSNRERARRQTASYKAAKKISSRRSRERKATVKEFRQIANLINVGLYQPKKIRRRNGRPVFTKKQAERARAIARKNEGLLKAHKFLKAPKVARAQFRRAGVKVTRRAVVIGDEGYDSFKLKRDRQGRYTIEALEKRKPGRRRKIDIITAIRPDDMVAQENAMRRKFNRLAKQHPGARFRAVIEGQWGTFKTFRADQFDAFIGYLSKYRRSNATLYNFRNNITLSVVIKGMRRNPVDQETEENFEGHLTRPIRRRRSSKAEGKSERKQR